MYIYIHISLGAKVQCRTCAEKTRSLLPPLAMQREADSVSADATA